MLRIEDVAERVGLSRWSVYRLSTRPDFPLPAHRIGVVKFYRAAEIDHWRRNRIDGRGRKPRRSK